MRITMHFLRYENLSMTQSAKSAVAVGQSDTTKRVYQLAFKRLPRWEVSRNSSTMSNAQPSQEASRRKQQTPVKRMWSRMKEGMKSLRLPGRKDSESEVERANLLPLFIAVGAGFPPSIAAVQGRSRRFSTTFLPRTSGLSMDTPNTAGASAKGVRTSESGQTASSGKFADASSLAHAPTALKEARQEADDDDDEEGEEEDDDDEDGDDQSAGDSPVVSSPPPIHVEPEVPDPFLMDSEDEGESVDEDLGASHSVTPADEISLARSSRPGSPRSPLTPNVNVNKDVPPPPAPESDEEDDDDAPDLYLPGLVIPSMFLPIPNVRRLPSRHHLTWWLSPTPFLPPFRFCLYHNDRRLSAN